MTVKCNFQKYKEWTTTSTEPVWDHKYEDFVSSVIPHEGTICTIKKVIDLCDQEDCIFFSKMEAK